MLWFLGMCWGARAETVSVRGACLDGSSCKTTLFAQRCVLSDAKCAQRPTVQVHDRRPFTFREWLFPALADHLELVSLSFHLLGTIFLEAPLIFVPVCFWSASCPYHECEQLPSPLAGLDFLACARRLREAPGTHSLTSSPSLQWRAGWICMAF